MFTKVFFVFFCTLSSDIQFFVCGIHRFLYLDLLSKKKTLLSTRDNGGVKWTRRPNDLKATIVYGYEDF